MGMLFQCSLKMKVAFGYYEEEGGCAQKQQAKLSLHIDSLCLPCVKVQTQDESNSKQMFDSASAASHPGGRQREDLTVLICWL